MIPIELYHHPSSGKSEFSIRGMLSRYQDQLSINLTISGPTEHIRLTPEPPALSRSHELWLSTCFEVFFKHDKTDAYLEFNLAPNGAWNWYSFTHYRSSKAHDLNQIKNIDAPGLTHTGLGSQEWRVNALIPLPKETPWILQAGATRASVCTILKGPMTMSYFSTHHPLQDQPDFHHPQSMTLIL